MFVFCGCRNTRVAGLARLLTAFSFQFTVGMWAGYYANWLALGESYLFLGLLLRFSNSKSTTSLVGLVVASVALLFTHPWTWDLMIVITAIFLVEHSIRSHDFRLTKAAIL